MTEYWLISAPGEKTCQQTWETMNNLTSKQNSLCTNYKFHIPDLKVGTLDQLVGLSDDLGKLDGFVEQATRKVAAYLGEVLEDQRDKLQENLMANNNTPTHKRRRSSVAHINNNRLKQQQRQLQQMLRCDLPDVPPSSAIGIGFPVDSKLNAADRLTIATPANGLRQEGDTLNNNNKGTIRERNGLSNGSAKKDDRLGLGDLPNYLMRFQWDIAKYPIKQSLRNIADIISKQVGQIDTDLKTKSTAYNNLKGSLQNLEKKQSGSLLTRNVADLVKKEHFILDSEYLTTLLVIVPKAQFNEWQVIYEKLTDMIVPRSSQMITQDSEYGLFTISLFKKVVDEFKVHAREKKFIVRDFTYNEEELAAGKNEITKLVTDKKKQFGPLVRWLKVNFSECFCAWIHVKALRVFVESVLRYGLPVNFQAILIHPNKKTSKRLRDVLNQLYIHLDGSALQGSQHLESVDIPGLGFGQSEYFPYVYYKINVDMIDTKQI